MTKSFDPDLEMRARDAISGLQLPEPRHADSPLSLHRVVAAMFRSRYLVFATTCLGFLVGAVVAVITPNSYMSTGKFMFTGSGSESVAVSEAGAGGNINESISQNATYLFTSNDLLTRVVDALTPEKILRPYSPEGESRSWLAGLFHSLQREYNATASKAASAENARLELQKSILVERPRNSNVLQVSALANSPSLAQEILRVYMHEAVQWHLEKYDPPNVYEEAKSRAEAAEKALEVARDALADFLEKSNVRDFDLELKAARERVLAQAAKLEEKQGLIKSAGTQIVELQKRLGEIQRTREVRTRPSSSILIESYNRQISNLEMQRSLKASTLKPESPEIAELDNQIKRVKQNFEDAQKAAAEEKEFTINEPNPQWDLTNNEMNKLILEQAKLGSDCEVQGQQFEASKALADKLNQLESQYYDLKRKEQRAEEDRKRASETLDGANRRRELKLGSFSLLQTIENASMPIEKEGPNRAKLVFGGLLAGLFLGIGLVLTRTVPDSTVRDREDLEGMDGIAVIGVMPRLDARNLRRHRALREQGW